MQVKTRPRITRSNTWSICKRELRMSFQATVRDMAERYARELGACQRREAENRDGVDFFRRLVDLQTAELSRPLPKLGRWLRKLARVKP